MSQWTTIRRFETKRFIVKLQWELEQDNDISWMDAEGLAKLESGEWINCTFRIAVYLDGCEIAKTHLGNSVYENPADFAREHYGTAGTGSGGYFSDMLREVIQETRQRLRERPPMPRIRDVKAINYTRR